MKNYNKGTTMKIRTFAFVAVFAMLMAGCGAQ